MCPQLHGMREISLNPSKRDILKNENALQRVRIYNKFSKYFTGLNLKALGFGLKDIKN